MLKNKIIDIQSLNIKEELVHSKIVVELILNLIFECFHSLSSNIVC